MSGGCLQPANPFIGDASIGIGIILDIADFPRSSPWQRPDIPQLLVGEERFLPRELPTRCTLRIKILDDRFDLRRHAP